MTTPIVPLDFSGVIPPEFSTQIIEEAVAQSAVLQLANTVPMGTSISEMPVPKTLPKASWVTAVGGRKAYTALGLEMETLHAEEIAAVTAIPDQYLEDASINLWGWVRPRLAEAIAIALDDAVLFGTGAPATFPTGGINAMALATGTGTDPLDTVNQAMSAVEAQGLAVNGSAADLVVKGALRGVRDATGALLLGFTQVDGRQVQTLYGVPITYTQFGTVPPDYFTGDWNACIIGVRQDIRYAMDPSAVIADDTGKVVISGFQDNTTPLKVWARFACALIKPVTHRSPNGAVPFAKATVSGTGTTRSETAQHASAKAEASSHGHDRTGPGHALHPVAGVGTAA